MPLRLPIRWVTMTTMNDCKRILQGTEMEHDTFLHQTEGVVLGQKYAKYTKG